MSVKNEANVNLTQGKNKEFDTLVKKTNEYLMSKVSRLTMVNNGGFKCYPNLDSPDREVPLVIEIRQHSNNTVTVLLGLEVDDIVVVTVPQIYNINQPVKFYNNVLYLRCVEQGSLLEQTFDIGDVKPTNKDPYQYLETKTSLASATNRLFLLMFIGDALMTDYHHNELLQIVVINRMMISKGSMFNSNVYKVLETEDGYKCEPVGLADDLEEDYIYIRHHYGKNEIQFYYTNKDKIHEILIWVESQSDGKFFIHRHVGKAKQDPTIRYRVCPVLFNVK